MWDVGTLLYVAGNGITEPLQQVPASELLEANAALDNLGEGCVVGLDF